MKEGNLKKEREKERFVSHDDFLGIGFFHDDHTASCATADHADTMVGRRGRLLMRRVVGDVAAIAAQVQLLQQGMVQEFVGPQIAAHTSDVDNVKPRQVFDLA